MSATILFWLKKSLTAGAEISSILWSNIFHFFIVCLGKTRRTPIDAQMVKSSNLSEFSTFLSCFTEARRMRINRWSSSDQPHNDQMLMPATGLWDLPLTMAWPKEVSSVFWRCLFEVYINYICLNHIKNWHFLHVLSDCSINCVTIIVWSWNKMVWPPVPAIDIDINYACPNFIIQFR